MKKLWFKLTAFWPRPLPTNQVEYDAFKKILVDYFDVPDEFPVWALVAGHITSTPAHRMTKPWGHIANAAKRIAVNQLAHDNRKAAMQVLQDRLAELTKQESERIQKEDQASLQVSPESVSHAVELIEQIS